MNSFARAWSLRRSPAESGEVRLRPGGDRTIAPGGAGDVREEGVVVVGEGDPRDAPNASGSARVRGARRRRARRARRGRGAPPPSTTGAFATTRGGPRASSRRGSKSSWERPRRPMKGAARAGSRDSGSAARAGSDPAPTAPYDGASAAPAAGIASAGSAPRGAVDDATRHRALGVRSSCASVIFSRAREAGVIRPSIDGSSLETFSPRPVAWRR